MRIEGVQVEGRLVTRDNRFRVTADVAGEHVWAHIANSGRLRELLVPGCRAILVARPGLGRKTGYDLSMVWSEGRWVSVDARLPNDLVAEALSVGQLHPLAGYPSIRREVSFGHSRFDFRLEAVGRPPCLLEVKSITLVVAGLACFPDAVTLRGRRHLSDLAEAVEAGHRTTVVFVVQRDDAAGMRPHDESDPGFGQALRDASRRGVEVYAYACQVEPGRVQITHSLPVFL